MEIYEAATKKDTMMVRLRSPLSPLPNDREVQVSDTTGDAIKNNSSSPLTTGSSPLTTGYIKNIIENTWQVKPRFEKKFYR